MVQTVRRMLSSSGDLYTALLSYPATPLPWCNLSPAELSMGRRLRTSLPLATKLLVPQWTYLTEFRGKNKQYKENQKKNFDRSHRAKPLTPIEPNSEVWITSERGAIPGRVVATSDAPRSYIVETPGGEVHRNRRHLYVVPTEQTWLQESNGTQQEVTQQLQGILKKL